MFCEWNTVILYLLDNIANFFAYLLLLSCQSRLTKWFSQLFQSCFSSLAGNIYYLWTYNRQTIAWWLKTVSNYRFNSYFDHKQEEKLIINTFVFDKQTQRLWTSLWFTKKEVYIFQIILNRLTPTLKPYRTLSWTRRLKKNNFYNYR